MKKTGKLFRGILFAGLLLASVNGRATEHELAAVKTAATNDVTITSLSTTTVCAGSSIQITYRVQSTFNPGNQFSVELSNASGSFAAPTVLRIFSATRSGIVNAPISVATPAGNGYRLRLVGSAPAVTSANNGTNITVNALATVNPAPNQVLCPGDQVEVSLSGSAPSFDWTINNPNVGIPASGTTIEPFIFILSNNTGVTQSAMVSVRPVAANGCVGKAMAFRVLVWPKPTVNSITPLLFCRNNFVPAIVFSGAVPGTTYDWTSSNPAVGLAPVSGTNVLPAFITANFGLVVSTITVTPTSPQGCLGDNMNFPIVVLPCINQPGDTGGDANTSRSANNLGAQITVGPNPARSTARITYSGNAPQLLVSVTDGEGRPMLRPFSFSGSSATFAVDGLRPGSYFVRVSDPRTGNSVQRILLKL
jgi:hypothetical protein